jgi:hypothetical protein
MGTLILTWIFLFLLLSKQGLNIEQIALSCRESSSSPEQTTLAALELSSLSTNLQKMVGEFSRQAEPIQPHLYTRGASSV